MKAARALVVVALIGSLIFNLVALGKLRKRAIITVNGQGISQKDLDSTLERQAGQEFKAQMVQKALIEQAAVKANVAPAPEEVDAAFNEQKELNWQTARELAIHPFKVDTLKDSIRLQLMQQNLLFKDINITDADIKEEYDRRPGFYDAPDKARTNLALVLKDGDIADIKGLMEKNTQPSVLMTQKRGQVTFLGDNNIYTFQRQFNGHSANAAEDALFKMKPGQVLQQSVTPQLAQAGAKAILIRMDHIESGKKADLNDPKVKKRIRNQLAATRSVPWKEYLNKLWTDMKFESEEPTDKKFIESILFPEKAAAEANR